MTELARRDEQVVARIDDVPATALGRWAYDARQAAAVAQSLARTPFVPASLRDRSNPDVTAANVTAVILTGTELGLEPMAALRSIDIIQGTPATRAVTVRAIVLSRGHDMWVTESTETRCIMRGKRAGSEQVQESVWTLDRAKKLGLTGKENWRKQPQAMLMARATSELGRLIAADALLGIPYSVEELDDGADSVAAGPDAASVEQAPARRTAQRRTRGQQAVARPPVATEEPAAGPPEPEFDEPPATQPAAAASEPEPVVEPDVPMISDKQVQKLAVSYNELGIKDRGERLTDVTSFLGRDVESSKDLTRDEATRLIDDLERRLSSKVDDDAVETDPCTVCGADAAKGEPHDEDAHEAAGV